MTSTTQSYSWKFHRIAGLEQAAVDSADALRQLGSLDPKLWVALSCPVKGLELDERTLALIDTDGDERIRVPELLAAVGFVTSSLKDPAVIFEPGDSLALDNISGDGAGGRALLTSARRILADLGKPVDGEITLEQAAGASGLLAASPFNGDGVVVPGVAGDAELDALLGEIVAAVGGEKDRSGKEGVSAAKVGAYFDGLAAYAAWAEKGADPAVAVLGERTAAAAAAVAAVRVKVDDYFARCRLAAFDPRAQAALNRAEADYAAPAARDLSADAAEFAAMPLARVVPGAELPLGGTVNPAWAVALSKLAADAVAPLLGRPSGSLSEEDWRSIKDRLSAYLAWESARPAAAFCAIGQERAARLLASGVRARIEGLVARDLSVAAEYDAAAAVERLLRYRRDLAALLRNFVNFFDFFSSDRPSVFQAGTLYLDSRETELCIRVLNPGAHASLAVMSKAYIAYVECRRPGCDPMNIAACFTQGDSDFLFVGRHGVFYDRAGRDWDATVVRIVDNPISIGQAFWSPYKRVVRFVEEQVAKRAAAADAAADARLQGAAASAEEAATTGKVPAAKPRFDVGTIAALGVAVGGITAALGAVLQAFFGLGIWMPLGLVGMVLLISGPSMLIAWLKLRQRNLGPLLEANGWAINGRVMINIRFGSKLTEVAVLPPNSRRFKVDPYALSRADRNRRIALGAMAALVVAFLAVAFALRTWPFGWVGAHAGPAPQAKAAAPASPAAK